MKRSLFAFCLTLLVVPALLAQELTSEDRAKALKYLEQTRAGVVKATRGLSEAQWNFKPATNRWSVAEVTEHIAAAEDFIRGIVEEKVLKSPARTEPADNKEIDQFILTKIPDRTKKAEAPEPLVPSNRFGSPKDTVKHFQDSRAKTVALLKQTKDLREHAMDAPIGKKLDAYQWLLFIGAHSERHTKQIEEVKADPNFPKK